MEEETPSIVVEAMSKALPESRATSCDSSATHRDSPDAKVDDAVGEVEQSNTDDDCVTDQTASAVEQPPSTDNLAVDSGSQQGDVEVEHQQEHQEQEQEPIVDTEQPNDDPHDKDVLERKENSTKDDEEASDQVETRKQLDVCNHQLHIWTLLPISFAAWLKFLSLNHFVVKVKARISS